MVSSDGSTTPTGMKRWPGGDSAPDDWDGTHNVEYRDEYGIGMVPEDWTHDGGPGDIIAYTPRPNPSGGYADGERGMRLTMKTIAEFPITDPSSNMDAYNMALTARAALDPHATSGEGA